MEKARSRPWSLVSCAAQEVPPAITGEGPSKTREKEVSGVPHLWLWTPQVYELRRGLLQKNDWCEAQKCVMERRGVVITTVQKELLKAEKSFVHPEPVKDLQWVVFMFTKKGMVGKWRRSSYEAVERIRKKVISQNQSLNRNAKAQYQSLVHTGYF